MKIRGIQFILAFAALAINTPLAFAEESNLSSLIPQPPANTDSVLNNGPVVVPPISFIDINSGRFGKLEIDLTEAQFLDAAVDKMHLAAQNLDLNSGTLQSLAVDIKGGHFQDFTFDNLVLETAGTLNFDVGVLLNQKILQFRTPATAQVSAVISEEGLNRFLKSPRTLDRLSVNSGKKLGFLKNLLGNNANIGLTVTDGNIKLDRGNRVTITMDTKLAAGGIGVPIPVQLNTRLGLKDGWVELTDTHLLTSGQEISPELSKIIVKKVNGLANWGQSTNDIIFKFTKLKVVPGNKFVLEGTADVNRLRFGRS
ncbi:MAG: hypothetical protein K2X29_11635 [Candidatus Obscuribacterales bacterium]|nr:hypothetical protein [Candidatus Obscuribacterales bacterium]